MIVAVSLIILSFLFALFDNQEYFKNRPVIKRRITVVLLLGIAIVSLVKENSDNGQKTTDSGTIKYLKGKTEEQENTMSYLKEKLDAFRFDAERSGKRQQDSAAAYHRDNKQEIIDMAYKMTKIFAENSKSNAAEHKKTQDQVSKIDTNGKLKPAYLGLLSEPHNAFQISFVDSLNLNGECWIKNYGDNVAYSLDYRMFIVFRTSLNKDFKVESTLAAPIDAVGGINRRIKFRLKSNSPMLHSSTKTMVCVVRGYFYHNLERTLKENFEIATQINMQTGEPELYSGSVNKLLESATTVGSLFFNE